MRTLFAAAATVAVFATAADASHNRGAAVIPTIDSQGNLTLEATTFWRPTLVDDISTVRITDPSGNATSLSMGARTTDTSDSRFTRSDQTASTDLTGRGAGLYTIEWSNCCRVSGVANVGASNFGTTSTIFWDGQNATNPITFDIQNIQPNVVRGQAYSDNLDVTSSNGNALSYDDSVLGVDMTSQAPGYSIDATGQIMIAAADTSTYPDNTSNDGADVAFSGEITATNRGQVTATVQFDWLFDAVAAGQNSVPDVMDVIVNATVGDTVNTNITASDPNGDAVTLSLLGFNGPGGAVTNATFTGGIAGIGGAGGFTWDTTGFTAGTYIASVLGNDGGLSDQGTITVFLSNATTTPPVPAVPLPAGAVLLLTALGGLGLAGLRRRRD